MGNWNDDYWPWGGVKFCLDEQETKNVFASANAATTITSALGVIPPPVLIAADVIPIRLAARDIFLRCAAALVLTPCAVLVRLDACGGAGRAQPCRRRDCRGHSHLPGRVAKHHSRACARRPGKDRLQPPGRCRLIAHRDFSGAADLSRLTRALCRSRKNPARLINPDRAAPASRRYGDGRIGRTRKGSSYTY